MAYIFEWKEISSKLNVNTKVGIKYIIDWNTTNNIFKSIIASMAISKICYLS